MSPQNQVVCVSGFADFPSMLGYFVFFLYIFSANVLQKHSVRTSITTATRAVSNAPDSLGQTSPVIFLATFFGVVFFRQFVQQTGREHLCVASRGVGCQDGLSCLPGPPRLVRNTHQSFLSKKLLMELEQ